MKYICCDACQIYMMTSPNGDIFRVAGHCAGNSPVPGEFPHKGQWRGTLMFSLICAWINGWVNNGKAGDLRRHHSHYGVTVMHATFKGKPIFDRTEKRQITEQGKLAYWRCCHVMQDTQFAAIPPSRPVWLPSHPDYMYTSKLSYHSRHYATLQSFYPKSDHILIA